MDFLRPPDEGGASAPSRGRGSVRRASRSLAWLVVVQLALLSAGGRPALAQELEYRVKAEFLERFTRFIEWPPESFRSPEDPFVIGVFGDNPFDHALVKIAEERAIKNRRVVVRPIDKASDAVGCHLVFVARSEAVRLSEVLASTAGLPILVVGDGDGAADTSAHLAFFSEGGRVRFTLNAAAVRQSHLRVSPQLFSLARVVGT